MGGVACQRKPCRAAVRWSNHRTQPDADEVELALLIAVGFRQKKGKRSMVSYYELLKHPQWQKKRLLVLERAAFCCENCGSGENTLHVHHTYYESGRKPWEYPDESLHALCEQCHVTAQDMKTVFDRQLGKIGYSAIDELYGYALGISSRADLEAPIDVLNYEVACGLADYWCLNNHVLISNLIEGKITGARLFELVAKYGTPQKPWLESMARKKET